MAAQLASTPSSLLANGSLAPPNGTVAPWHWDADFEAIVHPHWRNFPPVPEVYHYLVGVFISVVGIWGIVGNLLVIYIFSVTKSLRTAPNFFIINLAISDLTFSAVNGFPLLTVSSFNTRWAWGRLTCEMYGFIGGLFGFISITTMALIAVDRFFVIVQPFEQLKSLTKTRALVMCSIAWIWGLLWSIPPFFGYGSYVPEGFQTSCTFDYLSQNKGNIIFNAGMYIFGFTLPVLTIIFCYYKIVKAVRQHELEMMAMAKKLKSQFKSSDKKSDIQAAKTSVTIFVLFFLSWFPYALVALMSLVGRRDHLTPFTSEIPVLFAKSSAVYNPIVYALTHPKFRLQLEKKFPWLICCCPPKAKERETTSTTASKPAGRGAVSDTSSVSNMDSDNNVNKESVKGNETKNISAVEMTPKGQDNQAFERA
uniref:Rhabdomeric opsin n=1 Tax=Prostheceraeus crozeri TaxID=2291463 RepID=A0A5C2Q5B0_9PLAT|nr:rhabdomeric opsin [Maritigrella crozieri]